MKTVLVVGLLFAIGRVWLGVNVEPDAFTWPAAYKAAAHLFVGGLAVSAWRDKQAWQLSLFWGLCGLEIAVAIWSRL